MIDIGIDQEWINSLPGPRWQRQDAIVTEVDCALQNYDKLRKIAEEIFKRPGMEEAIIDELKAMGFEIIAST